MSARQRSQMLQSYVNIFKKIDLESWKQADQTGDVSSAIDKDIGKKVFRIWGSVPAANYILIPKSKSQSLVLPGRYLYLEFKIAPGRFFVVHFDLVTTQGLPIRVSISNLFKGPKFSTTEMQFPYTDATSKWTILAIDFVALLQQFTTREFGALRGMQLGASMFVRNAYSSDTRFTPGDLPREMDFPVAKGRDWHDLYEFTTLPHNTETENDLDAPTTVGDVRQMTAQEQVYAYAIAGSKDPPSFVYQAPRSPLGTHAENHADAPPPVRPATATGRVPTGPPPTEQRSHTATRSVKSGRSERVKKLGLRSMVDEEVLASILPTPHPIPDPATEFLQPDPICTLSRVVGFSGDQHVASGLLWSADASEIVFVAESTIVVMNVATKEQRFLLGHTASVCALSFNADHTTLASAQAGPEALVRLWDFATGEPLAVLRAHASSMIAVTLSNDAKLLCGVGKEPHGKQLVQLWDTSRVAARASGVCHKLASALCDHHIQRIKFSPFGDNRMVSCGRDNVRMWRLRGSELRSSPVPLGNNNQHFFTDLDFEYGVANRDPAGKRVFLSTASGMVFQVDYTGMVLEAVYALHDGAINSLAVVEGFCVTVSDDCFLRVWPLDFTAHFLEAQHDAPVTAVDISYDCLRLVCGTQNGTVGRLDVASYAYETLVRSHSGAVHGLAIDPVRPEFTTLSRDGTTRVWSLTNLEQMYEFEGAEQCCAAAYHPTEYVLACGFQGGVVRVFDVATTTMRHEYRQHEGPVVALAFTADGATLFSAGVDGVVTVYDVARGYHPIRMLSDMSRGAAVSLATHPTERLVAYIGPNASSVTVLDVSTLRQLHVVHMPAGVPVAHIVFGAGSADLVVTSHARLMRFVLPEASGVRPSMVSGVEHIHDGPPTALTANRTRRYILTGGVDRKLRVWDYPLRGDTPSSQAFIGHPETIERALFSHDERYIVSVGGRTVHVWQFHGDTTALPEAAYHPEPEPAVSEHTSDAGDHEASRVSIVEERGHSSTAAASRGAGAAPSGSPKVRKPYTRVHREVDMPAKHIVPQAPRSLPPGRRYVPSETGAALTLERVMSYSGTATHDNLLWEPASGLWAYTAGTSVIIEDLETRAQRLLAGSEQPITTLALRPDMQVLATGSAAPAPGAACPVKLWHVPTGECMADLLFHEHGVQALAFSCDGRYLLSVGSCDECSVALWDVSSTAAALLGHARTPAPIHMAMGDPLNPSAFALAGHGAMVWVTIVPRPGPSGLTMTLELTKARVPAGAELADWTALEYDGVGHLFAGTQQGQVTVWTATEHAIVGSWLADDSEIDVIQCRGRRVLTAGVSGQLKAWSIPDLGALADLDAADRNEAASEGSSGGEFIASHLDTLELDGTAVVALQTDAAAVEGMVGLASGSIWYFNTTEARVARLVSSHPSDVTALAFNRTGNLLASASVDGSLRVWQSATMEQIMQFQATRLVARGLEFHGRELAAGYSDGCVRFFDVNTVTRLRQFRAHTSPVTCLTYAAAGRFVITGAESGTVAIHAAASGAVVREIEEHRGAAVQSIAVCPSDPRMFLVSSADRRVSIWQADWKAGTFSLLDWLSFTAPATLPIDYMAWPEDMAAPPSLTVWLPDAASPTLAYAGYAVERELVIYDVARHAVTRTVKLNQWVASLDVSADGRLFLIGTRDRMVKVIDASSGTFQDYAVGHSAGVDAVRFGPSAGHWVATAAHGEVLTWKLVK